MWFTLNCRYNEANDIHRLHDGSPLDKSARHEFVRDCPDLVAYVLALRAELLMKVVMPSVMPHSAEKPFLSMARFEVGKGGNGHHHGFCAGDGNIPLGPVVDAADPSVPPAADNEAGSDATSSDESSAPAVPEELAPSPMGAEGGSLGGPRVTAESEPDGHGVLEGAPKKRRRSLGAASDAASVVVPDATPGLEGGRSQAAWEKVFSEFYGGMVSEWNPCFSDDGAVRYLWDDELQAHDVEAVGGFDLRCPERVRLSEVLHDAFKGEAEGQALNLQGVRRLVAALVQSSGRHTHHQKNPPVLGKHPCARGTAKCPVCRYGFPHDLFCPSDRHSLCLVRGPRGEWFARAARNDALCCSWEEHLLLANMGNIDWRIVLELHAVIEYVAKYAAKPAEGSRNLRDVLRSAVEEVCKYSGQDSDVLRQSLAKFYAKTLGDRDYGIFETVFLGMRLPLIIQFMPVVSLNTRGSRNMKRPSELAGASDDAKLTWDSKVDKFDKRLSSMRRVPRARRAADDGSVVSELEIRFVSLYEFYCKYYFGQHGRPYKGGGSCIMVTPSFSAECSVIGHSAFEAYARSSVVAYFRCMPTQERYLLLKAGPASDVRLWGASVFKELPVHPAAPELDRYLGIQDLVMEFDGGRRREMVWNMEADPVSWLPVERRVGAWQYGWKLAFLEMLVDPLLLEWVPMWVRDRFYRWNPDFSDCLKVLLSKDAGKCMRNRELLQRAAKTV
jgi:hypothetical protein